MPVRDTSIQAYRDTENKRSTLADQVCSWINRHAGIHTRAELARDLDIPTSTMSGIINRLIGDGRIKEAPGRFHCDTSGRQVRGVTSIN